MIDELKPAVGWFEDAKIKVQNAVQSDRDAGKLRDPDGVGMDVLRQ